MNSFEALTWVAIMDGLIFAFVMGVWLGKMLPRKKGGK